MSASALPGRSDQYGPDRRREPLAGVGDHQLDITRATGAQGAQDRGPKRPVLGVATRQAKHLATTVGAEAGFARDDPFPVPDGAIARAYPLARESTSRSLTRPPVRRMARR